tara:strand:+ start:92202 stop:93863 length:1662 start_codon:yes stop_codon:yes gene_type:complete
VNKDIAKQPRRESDDPEDDPGCGDRPISAALPDHPSLPDHSPEAPPLDDAAQPLGDATQPLDDAALPLDDSDGYSRALQFLYDRINYERMSGNTARYPFRLSRMRRLLQRLSLAKYLHATEPTTDAVKNGALEPDSAAIGRTVPIVHIAGTKGKGSTASMVAAALTAGGNRTGLYTSPHLHRLEERFRIDGIPCQPGHIVRMVDQLRSLLDSSQRSPEKIGTCSFFELTTAMALMHFDAQDCDAIVLEVGLGGRLDSTNVCSPAVVAITPIGLDHQHVLGDTLESIATEKAGIIKSSAPVVCGISSTDPAMEQVIRVISQRADEHGAPLYLRDRDFQFQHSDHPDWGSRVHFRGITPPMTHDMRLDLALDGRHQSVNAATAIAIVDLLREQGFGITVDAAARGIGQLRCPARIERFSLPHDTVAIVDAAHNKDSIEALCRCVQRRRGDRSVAVVFGTSRDKSAGDMLPLLAEVADHIVLTQFAGNPRFTPTEELLPLVPESMEPQTQVAKDPIQACRQGLQAVGPGGMLVVCGSFFVAAETRQWIAEQETRID